MKPLMTPLIAALVLAFTRLPSLADSNGFIYAYGLADSHAEDTFYSVDAFRPLGQPRPFRPYLELSFQRDSREFSRLLPQPLNDNYGLVAGGMQYQGRKGLRIFAQLGEAFAFGPQLGAPWDLRHGDFRAGLEDFRDWSDSISNPRRAVGSFYGSAVYYNRYQNEIVYVAAERGREFGALEHPVQLYGRVAADGDTRRYFYNNAFNATLGARYLPLGHAGPSLALEESYNSFVGPLSPITAAGYTRTYFSFRPVLSFGASF